MRHLPLTLSGVGPTWSISVCHVRPVMQAEQVKSYITTTGPITSELLAIIALRNQEQLVGRCVSIIQNNIALAEAFFAK